MVGVGLRGVQSVSELTVLWFGRLVICKDPSHTAVVWFGGSVILKDFSNPHPTHFMTFKDPSNPIIP